MILRDDLLTYLNNLLTPKLFNDYAPNGLQIEGGHEIKKLVTGVSACQKVIDKAIEEKADAILVHHGFFWKNESLNITGMRKNRIKALLANDISLFAYHLPLDAHPLYGNNALLASLLNIEVTGGLEDKENSIGNVGIFSKSYKAPELIDDLTKKLGRTPIHISSTKKEIKTVAWCTGGAQSYIELAIEKGVDAFITGEVSENTYHIAIENDIHFFSCGHHATERYGVQAIGELIAKKNNIEHLYIEVNNPI